MPTSMNRIVISVPKDIEREIERLKQSSFYNKPYAEIYRQAIRLGLKRMNEAKSSTDAVSE